MRSLVVALSTVTAGRLVVVSIRPILEVNRTTVMTSLNDVADSIGDCVRRGTLKVQTGQLEVKGSAQRHRGMFEACLFRSCTLLSGPSRAALNLPALCRVPGPSEPRRLTVTGARRRRVRSDSGRRSDRRSDRPHRLSDRRSESRTQRLRRRDRRLDSVNRGPSD